MACKHLKVLPDRDGKVRVRQTGFYLCTVKIEWPPLPNSVPTHRRILPTPSHVSPGDCAGCPLYARES